MSSAVQFVLSQNTELKKANGYWFVDHGFFGYVVSAFTVVFTGGHLLIPFIAYELFANQTWATFFWTHLLCFFIAFGMTCGTHLHWAHKSYEARWPLKVLYMILHTSGAQFSMLTWIRDHRVHHKWSDTDGDPHNPSRGVMFCHIGWLYRPLHPEMVTRSQTLDYSDLHSDPVIMFQHNHYTKILAVFGFIIPMAVPVYFWNESLWTAFLVTVPFRILLMAHVTLMGNSAAHNFGDKPYNANIAPTDSVWTAIIMYGAGYHNFHHMFPSDYASSEPFRIFNFSRDLIKLMAKVGLAYNLKTASQSVVDKEKAKVLREKNARLGITHFHETADVGYEVMYQNR
ncbi:Delta(9)-fatty-acid desaturase fat-6 [Halotydeus destructor]|nr:Delta(9)-fatty-acid desaturase fat-6 [Halotydeus destructor]KAI1286032.1 Delta(9)-fatty-acid desaturase fat-6 [Halotydeus destructor]